MARFSQIAKGTQARQAFTLEMATAPGAEPVSVVVDVRPLTTAEEVAALADARAYAVSKGLPDPKEGQPVYDLAVMGFVVFASTVDHDSPPAAPAPFFDDVGQVLSLDRDRLQLLYEAQAHWQEQCSPRRTTLTPAEYAATVYVLAGEGGDDADPFLSRLPRATLVSLARTMARQLVGSPTPRSPSSSSGSASGESASPSPDPDPQP